MGAPFIATAVFFYQLPLAESKGWTLAWLAASFPAFAAAHLLSLSFSGPLIDRFDARRLLPWHLTPLLLALLALALADGRWLAPLYLGLAGLGMGLANSLMGMIWVELYGSTHLGAICSLAQSAMLFSTTVAPVSVGLTPTPIRCMQRWWPRSRSGLGDGLGSPCAQRHRQLAIAEPGSMAQTPALDSKGSSIGAMTVALSGLISSMS